MDRSDKDPRGGLPDNGKSGKITAIEAQQNRRGRVNLYLDDRFAFSLSEVVAVRARLKLGGVLSPADVNYLTLDDTFQKALDNGLRFLSHRQRSERELRQNLTRKGISQELIDSVVVRLKELKLIDDAAFARFWVDNRDRFNPRGAAALRSELLAKGVDRATVDEAIADGSGEEGRARAIAVKQLGRLRGMDQGGFVQRMVAALVRRGFSYDVAYSTARSLWQSPFEGVDGD